MAPTRQDLLRILRSDAWMYQDPRQGLLFGADPNIGFVQPRAFVGDTGQWSTERFQEIVSFPETGVLNPSIKAPTEEEILSVQHYFSNFAGGSQSEAAKRVLKIRSAVSARKAVFPPKRGDFITDVFEQYAPGFLTGYGDIRVKDKDPTWSPMALLWEESNRAKGRFSGVAPGGFAKPIGSKTTPVGSAPLPPFVGPIKPTGRFTVKMDMGSFLSKTEQRKLQEQEVFNTMFPGLGSVVKRTQDEMSGKHQAYMLAEAAKYENEMAKLYKHSFGPERLTDEMMDNFLMQGQLSKLKGVRRKDKRTWAGISFSREEVENSLLKTVITDPKKYEKQKRLIEHVSVMNFLTTSTGRSGSKKQFGRDRSPKPRMLHRDIYSVESKNFGFVKPIDVPAAEKGQEQYLKSIWKGIADSPWQNYFKGGLGTGEISNEYQSLYEQAFHDRLYYLDIETTGNARKKAKGALTSSAEIYQFSLSRNKLGPATGEHIITNQFDVTKFVSQQRGLREGETLTIYTKVNNAVPRSGKDVGRVNINWEQYVDIMDNKGNSTKVRLGDLVGYSGKKGKGKGPTGGRRAKGPSKSDRLHTAPISQMEAWKAIKNTILGGDKPNIDFKDVEGAVVFIHNSDFDLEHIRNLYLRELQRSQGGPFKASKALAEPGDPFSKGRPKKMMQQIHDVSSGFIGKTPKFDPILADIYNSKQFIDEAGNRRPAVYVGNPYENFMFGRLYADSNTALHNKIAHIENISLQAKHSNIRENRKLMQKAAMGYVDNMGEFRAGAKDYLVDVLKVMAEQKKKGAGIAIIDTMHVFKATNVLLQNYGYLSKRHGITAGTALDTLGLSTFGVPLTHLESTDNPMYQQIVQERFKHVILPLLSSGKLGRTGAKMVYVENRLANIRTRRNIYETVFSKYMDAVQLGEVEIAGVINTKAEKMLRFQDITGLAEEADHYAQPSRIEMPANLEKPLRESLESWHGKNQADVIQGAVQLADEKYKAYFNWTRSAKVPHKTKEGDIIFEHAGYGKSPKGSILDEPYNRAKDTTVSIGDVHTMTVDRRRTLAELGRLKEKSGETFKLLETVYGNRYRRRAEVMDNLGLNPLRAGRLGDMYDFFYTALVPVEKQVAHIRKEGLAIERIHPSIKLHTKTVAAKDNEFLTKFLSDVQHRNKSILIGGLMLAGAGFAAYKRHQAVSGDGPGQHDLQERFDFYLSGTGASTADGSSDISVDVLSSEDRESWSTLESLNLYDKMLETDHSSPFKGAKVSEPMARQMSTNNVIKTSASRPSIGYNVIGGKGITKSLNRQSQAMNHSRLAGKYCTVEKHQSIDL